LAFSSAANLTPADGNGRLGAMVFGGTVEERLQLNESTLWGAHLDTTTDQGIGQSSSQ
jgi:hypothetical protein